MQAPQVMLAAVRKVPKDERLHAMRCAEIVFFQHLTTYRADPETFAVSTDADAIAMAAEAAAAEVAFRFA